MNNGCVKMYRTADSANNGSPATWVVEKPDGAILDTSASVTQGLQEAMDYASWHGYNFKKYAGGCANKNGQDVSILGLAVSLAIPPLQGAHWEIDGTITFGGGFGGSAVIFDSLMISTILWRGQILTAPGWAVAVHFKPMNELPQDGAGPVITSSIVHIPAISMTGPGSCVVFDSETHPIIDNEFRFVEPNNNGVAGSTGITVKQGSGFIGNQISAVGAHGSTVAGISNGISGINAGNMYGNSWFVSMAPTSGIGLEDFSWQDEFTMSIAGTPSIGYRAPSGIQADNWRYRVLRNQAATPFAMR